MAAAGQGRGATQHDLAEPLDWRRHPAGHISARTSRFLHGGEPPSHIDHFMKGVQPGDDLKQLHAVLLGAGGFADTRSILFGLRWNLDRLEAAAAELRRALEPLGECLLKLPDGIYELRGYRDRDVNMALRCVASRAAISDGLPPNAAVVLYRILTAEDCRLDATELQTPDELDGIWHLTALDAIYINDIGSIELTYNAKVSLTGGPTRSELLRGRWVLLGRASGSRGVAGRRDRFTGLSHAVSSPCRIVAWGVSPDRYSARPVLHVNAL